MSNPTEALKIPLESLQGWSSRHQGTSDSVASTIVELRSEYEGTVHAISAWYNLHMLNDGDRYIIKHLEGCKEGICSCNVVNTGPFILPNDTSSAHRHWRQVCFLMEKPISVSIGDLVNVEVILDITCGVWCRRIV